MTNLLNGERYKVLSLGHAAIFRSGSASSGMACYEAYCVHGWNRNCGVDWDGTVSDRGRNGEGEKGLLYSIVFKVRPLELVCGMSWG